MWGSPNGDGLHRSDYDLQTRFIGSAGSRGAIVIIVELKGGLGNQLFQYAAGRRLSLTLGVPLKLDISRYKRHGQRTYELDQFCIEAGIAKTWEVLLWRVPDFLTRITRPLGLLPRLMMEKSFDFDPAILHLGDGKYLDGYWQSYRYFTDVAPEIRRELAVRAPPSDADQKLLDRMAMCDSVCLHVRRGDYASNPITQQFHGLCTSEYYRTAVEAIAAQLPAPELFVFSDDMPWVKHHLRFELPTTHVEHHGVDSAPLELRLMAGCRHFVIANSSLSWWAAWLSANEKPIVYAPRRWFADPAIDTSELTPPAWQRI